MDNSWSFTVIHVKRKEQRNRVSAFTKLATKRISRMVRINIDFTNNFIPLRLSPVCVFRGKSVKSAKMKYNS